MDIKVETRMSGDWAVVEVEGEVDVFTAPKLREQMIALLTAGNDRIVVNLAKVDFMDSTGLGVLVGALKRVKEKDGSLAIAGAHGTVLRVLSVTGLSSVFPLHDTVEQATVSS
ncbi:MAG: STAS domain-containing protein [Actinomycetota bacterium]